MPPLPGEETLATLYSDIHYYFAQPTLRPVLHRFDKASYFYIYYNSTRRTSRIEVANNPGTPDQDAFSGYLDSCRIINSHKFPTLVTLVVDGAKPTSSPSSPRSAQLDQDEWRLASADPRDAGRSKYRLHTLDVYFWAPEDARLAIDLFKRLLHTQQLDVAELDPEPDQHQELVSPVVQNLENVAISDPAYQNGKTRNSQSQPEFHQVNVPPPPPPPTTQDLSPHAASVSPISNVSRNEARSTGHRDEPAHNYTPMAYNPAAPPAPEPIAHREDTPPPVDGEQGTGLAAAAIHDHPYSQQSQHPQPYTGVPGIHPNQFGQYGSPPPPTGLYGTPPPQQRASATSFAPSFGPPPTSAASPDSRHQSIAAQHYVPSSADPNAHLYGQQPVQTPGSQFYTAVNSQPHKPLQHIQPQYPDYLAAGSQASPPPGGYSQYHYGQAQQHGQPGNPYDIHSQVYRPTESEASSHHHNKKPSRSDTTSSSKPSKFDQRADKVEKGVGRLFKRIEKKIG